MSKQTQVPWEVRTIYAGLTNRVSGYMVERIHKPYTIDATAEVLRDEKGRNFFRSEEEARAAIAKAGVAA